MEFTRSKFPALVAALALGAGLLLARHAPGETPEALPRHLAETGLYTDDGRIAADVIAFAPQYPLWTDGATKRRWIRLPEGTSIDASDPDVWEFPVGTQVWKEFSFGRPVETRYMERADDGSWRMGTYLWTEDGEAVLVPQGAVVDVGDGRRHDVPSTGDCLLCHDNGASPVLGFSTLQLSPDRDPGALHADAPGATLPDLVARGVLVGLPDRLLADPPRIDAEPTERGARGYLHGNCGGCHDATGPLASLGMDLRWSADESTADPPARASTWGRPSRAPLPSDPGSPSPRIAPGDPDHSVLLGRMGSRDPQHQMPPLGTRAVDDEAVALIARWIVQAEAQTDIARRTP